jgi:hypothetical protein
MDVAGAARAREVIAASAGISGVTQAERAAGFARRADGVTEMVRSAHIVTAALPIGLRNPALA